MHTKTYYISGLSLLAGGLFFAYMQEWIILRMPHTLSIAHQDISTSVANQWSKKRVKLSYWHKGTWHTEDQDLIWSNDTSTNIGYLINSLLTLLDEEMIMEKKVTLQTVLLATTGNQAYLSFDQNPLSLESSTYTKWMWLEGILKTLRDNGIPIRSVHFLVHHQPLEDDHLDCSRGWPLTGFLP